MLNPNRVIFVGLVLAAALVGVDRYVTPHAVQHVPSGPDPIGVGCTDAVGTDSYACTLSPAITAYVTGACHEFKAGTANTGAATINFNALGAKTIVKVAGGVTTALADNDIRSGSVVSLCYDGTNMQMQSTLGNAAGGGGLVLLETKTASASASLDFTSTITTTYNVYVVKFEAFQLSDDNVGLDLLVSTNAGVSYETTSYDFAAYRYSGSGSTFGGSTSGFRLDGLCGMDNTAATGAFGIVRLAVPLSTSVWKRVVTEASVEDNASATCGSHGGGAWQSTTAVNAFQIKPTAGTITSGVARSYGIAK